jgi:phosphoribosylanthranilate isomerase
MVFAPSPRRVTPGHARHLAEAARDEARAVERTVDVYGLFVNERADVIARIVDEASVDVVQLHGDETIAFASALGLPRMVKAVRVAGEEAIEEVTRAVASGLFESVLLDAFDERARGGTGRTFDWAIAARVARSARIVLAGGLKPDNVRQAVERVGPFMVDVSSGVETSPGVKDHGLLRRFVAEARGVRTA